MAEKGILNRISKHWLSQPGGEMSAASQQQQLEDSKMVLGFDVLSLPFLITAFGIVCALCCALLERAHSKHREK